MNATVVRLALLGSFLAASARAETYFVSPMGDDSNDGLSATAVASGIGPWATLGKANATLRAGDEVRILAGRYDDPIRPARNGTSDAQRIIYRAFGNGDVVLTQLVESRAMVLQPVLWRLASGTMSP